jgi:hypothetical protein
VTRTPAADDFAAISARMEELRCERTEGSADPEVTLPISVGLHANRDRSPSVPRSKLPPSIHRSLMRQRALRVVPNADPRYREPVSRTVETMDALKTHLKFWRIT